MKLRKIVLHEGNEVLQQNEMKMIKGGEENAKSCDKTCTGSCREFILLFKNYKDGNCTWDSVDDGKGNEYLACVCKINLKDEK